MKRFILILFTLVLSFSACQTKPVRKPVTNIEVIASNQLIKHGENITIKINTKTFGNKLKETKIYLNNQEIRRETSPQFQFCINTSELLPGRYLLKTVAVNDQQLEGTNLYYLSIISNIIPDLYTYKTVGTLSHNTGNFTQGFEFHDQLLYEGTGNYGTSFIYAYQTKNMKPVKSLKIDDQYFGEGITILNDKIFQLTYKKKKGFVYDLSSFKKLEEFTFDSDEGWGLTNDGKNLIMSDGTSKITYLDPVSFTTVKQIEVSNQYGWVDMINELEYVDGYIYANVWTKDIILKIDSNNGKIIAQMNMKGLLNQMNQQQVDVLNGIAWNREEQLFYITGKYWPTIYKVEFVKQSK